MASASVTLTGKVRKTKIAREGTAVVVKKTLGDGTTLEERFPKRRMRGKRKDMAQMIPAQDVVRAMEAYAETIEPEVQRRVDGVNQYANQMLDQEIAKHKKRTRRQAERTVAARRVAGHYKQEVNRQKEADEAMERKQRKVAESLRDKIAARTVGRRNPLPSSTALGL
jgi:hypothetical protein